MMNSKTIILCDGHPLMYRSAYAGSGESYVCEGIVKYFYEILARFPGADVLLFFDDGKSAWRTKFYPEYKANRDKKKQELNWEEIGYQKDNARKFLNYLGVRDISVRGVEADDLIAWSTEYFSYTYDRVIIATRDRDMLQLVNPKVSFYDPLDNLLITPYNIVQEFGVEARSVVDLKSLEGDTSDNLKGVPGVGKKTAQKLLDSIGGISELLNPENAKALRKTKTSAKILDNPEELELSHQLIKLPTLYEASSYLTEEQFLDIKHHLTKPVTPDALMVQVETQALAINTPTRYVNPLTEEVLGILPFLEKKPAQTLTSLSEIDSAIQVCNRCPLRQCGNPVLASGYGDAQVMLVGRNPSETDSELYDNFLEEVGLSKREVWITNACKCPSYKDKPVSYGELQACSAYLRAEIELIKPKFIIAFGNEAMSLVTEYSSGVVKHCGEILKNSDEIWVAIMIHPRHAKRGKKNQTDFDYGTKKVKEFLDERRS